MHHVEVAHSVDNLADRIGTVGSAEGYHFAAEVVEVHFGLVDQVDVSSRAVLETGMEQVMELVATLTPSSWFYRNVVDRQVVDLS